MSRLPEPQRSLSLARPGEEQQGYEDNAWTLWIKKWRAQADDEFTLLKTHLENIQDWQGKKDLDFKHLFLGIEHINKWIEHLLETQAAQTKEMAQTRAMVAQWRDEVHVKDLAQERRLQSEVMNQDIKFTTRATQLEGRIVKLEADVSGLHVRSGYWGIVGAIMAAAAAGVWALLNARK